MMPHPDYWPYRRLVSSVVDDVRSGRLNEVTIFGGRGLGKTAVAAALLETFSTSIGLQPVTFIRGRCAALAATELSKISPGSALGALIVDDVEYLLEHSEAREHFSRLVMSIPWLNDRRMCIVLTAESVARLQEAAKADVASSDFITKTTCRMLEPWATNWQQAIDHAVKQILEHRLPQSWDASREAWGIVIAQESGGHPSLVGRALEIMRGALEHDATAFPEQPEQIRAYLAPLIEPFATSLVSKATEQYRLRLEREFFRLVDVAARGGGNDIPWSALETGLAYSTPASGKALVGGLTQRALASLGVGESLRVCPDTTSPELKGEIVRFEGSRRIGSISLSESLWRLFTTLSNARGEVVAVSELLDCVNSESEKALNSSLQRLRASLEKLGIGDALQNVRGRGYRWDPNSR